MIFCGQCGLQLPPGSTRCPRCGTVVEQQEGVGGELHVDDPTMASPSFTAHQAANPGQPSMAGGQGTPGQPLILRPGNIDYNTQGANDATSMMDASAYNYNPRMSGPQNMGASFVGGSHPNQGSYANYGTQTGYMQTGMDYTGVGSATGYGPAVGNQQSQRSLRTAALVLIVLGVLLIMSAVILFALQRNGLVALAPTELTRPVNARILAL